MPARDTGANFCYLPYVSGKLKGFSLIELIIVIAILSILMSVFLDRVWYFQEMAEKAAMEENVGAIQSALTMLHAKGFARGAPEDVNRLTRENPVKWLQKPPRNYAGEFFNPTFHSVAPGSWIFDLKERELIYVLDRSDYFVPGKDGVKWIRFHINLQYEPLPQSGVQSEEQELVGSIFEPKDQVKWF